ncbi:hypothetical protein L6452_31806 [Arctium lappa]|uniref:Uncharacterized protein n=1 Tax=Arctium lappa TaxID=4217 RepID=A0ACB8Z2T6_ARCLA|nr:hypothetical protein L6452_31806 [Arctium lappa]
MSTGMIVKELTERDTSYHGQITLPKRGVDEHFIPRMDESLQHKLLEVKAPLEVVLHSEHNGQTKRVLLKKNHNNVFIFTNFGDVVRSWSLNSGDVVLFNLEGFELQRLWMYVVVSGGLEVIVQGQVCHSDSSCRMFLGVLARFQGEPMDYVLR